MTDEPRTPGGGPGGEPAGERESTSHERRSGEDWDASYLDGPAPWDIGRAQPAVVRVAAEGGFTGSVLDAGCGTGENTLHIASRGTRGLHVLGVDVALTALALARAKAAARGIDAEFEPADAFKLQRLKRSFTSVLDCGLFHTFNAEERPRYVASLAAVTERGGTLHVLCFSDEGPEPAPHPVTRDELREAFAPATGWNLVSVESARIETRIHDDGAPAWLVRVERL